MRKISSVFYRLLGIFLSFIIINCVVFGVALLNINFGYNFL